MQHRNEACLLLFRCSTTPCDARLLQRTRGGGGAGIKRPHLVRPSTRPLRPLAPSGALSGPQPSRRHEWAHPQFRAPLFAAAQPHTSPASRAREALQRCAASPQRFFERHGSAQRRRRGAACPFLPAPFARFAKVFTRERPISYPCQDLQSDVVGQTSSATMADPRNPRRALHTDRSACRGRVSMACSLRYPASRH